MLRISRGGADFVQGNVLIFSGIFACVYFEYSHLVLRCPNSSGRCERSLLPPRVYLQTATLMRCNDYFYSRYFGSPLALSRMTPYWPADYLCGCCHTWLLQIYSLSNDTPSEPALFYCCTLICSHFLLFFPTIFTDALNVTLLY